MNFFPPSPYPLPDGKGEIFDLFRRGLPPPAPLRLNPSGTGTGAAYHAPTGGAGGAGAVYHGGGRERRTASAIHSEKFLGVWGLLSRSPRTLPCHGARREEFVTGQARTEDCTSNSFGKSSWGFGGFFQEAPNVSSFFVLRSFVSPLRRITLRTGCCRVGRRIRCV